MGNNRKIILKSEDEIALMREGGKITAMVMSFLLQEIKPGRTSLELDTLAERKIGELGGIPSFKNYRPDGMRMYPNSLCICVNDGLVHGLPNKTPFKGGDIVSVDLGVLYKGFHTDMSRSVVVEGDRATTDPIIESKKRFISVGKQAFTAATSEFRRENRVGDISRVIQKKVESAGYSVSRDLTGHGVGRDLHEEPTVYCYFETQGEKIKEGLVLAIEVIYTQKSPEILLDKDGWTFRTKDGGWGGLYEDTVALTNTGPIVLTAE